jgi:hypothetical protein
MQRAVVCRTYGEQVAHDMSATRCTGLQVMQVQEHRVLTARDLAAMLIPLQHGAAQRWRNALFGPRGRSRICLRGAHVGGCWLQRESLAVTLRHLHDGVVHGDAATAGRLLGGATTRARAQRDLIRRAAVVAAFLVLVHKNTARQLEQCGIVAQRGIAAAPELREGIAQESVRLGADLEAQDMTNGTDIGRCRGQANRDSAA